MDKTVVITGANSYLGSMVVGELMKNTDYQIIAIGSPRAKENLKENGRIRYFKSDLTVPLSSKLSQIVGKADWVLHFAWARGPSLDEVNKENFAIIDNIFSVLANSTKFCLISSVAASPTAKSTYGKAKYLAMQQVRGKGGISLVLGLVMGKPAGGAFRMLLKFIKFFPISLRLEKNVPQVYPIGVDDVFSGIRAVLKSQDSQGDYKLFGKGLSFNNFFEILEKKYLKFRVPLILPTKFVLALSTRLPGNLAQKITTFIHKDEQYLAQHKPIPEFENNLDEMPEF